MPIEVKFTIQSKRELQFFLAYFNASGDDQAAYANAHSPSFAEGNFSGMETFVNIYTMWKDLDSLYHKL
jgi:hypothetical protein